MKKIAFSTFLIVLLITLAYLRRPDLAFHDLYLITTTSDPKSGTMVSFGFGHYIKVLNDDWGKQALSSLPAPPPR